MPAKTNLVRCLGQRKLSKLGSSDSREMPHTFTNNPQKVLTMGAAAEEWLDDNGSNNRPLLTRAFTLQLTEMENMISQQCKHISIYGRLRKKSSSSTNLSNKCLGVHFTCSQSLVTPNCQFPQPTPQILEKWPLLWAWLNQFWPQQNLHRKTKPLLEETTHPKATNFTETLM